jgi:hypothetical protein
MTPEEIDNNIQQFNTQYETVKEHIDDNFKYDINRNDDGVLIKTYIGVSVYPSIFNQYFSAQELTSATKLDQVKDRLTQDGYTCKITRK